MLGNSGAFADHNEQIEAYLAALDKKHACMRIKKEDVWGTFDEETHKMTSEGMVVARGGERCPIFGDEVPYKAVTVICKPEDVEEVIYWLEYVQGGDCITRRRKIRGGKKIAFRAEYMCW